MADLVLVHSGGQPWLLDRCDVATITYLGLRSTAPALAALLGAQASAERYELVLAPGLARSTSVAAADLVHAGPALPLPALLQGLSHPAVAGFVIHNDHLIPLLHVRLLQEQE